MAQNRDKKPRPLQDVIQEFRTKVVDAPPRLQRQLADSAEQLVLAGSSTNRAHVQNDLAEDAAASVASASSAAQLASKKRPLDIDPSCEASRSASQPGPLLEQVKQLGRYPKRSKTPATDKERAEDSLAQKMSKQWSKVGDATKEELSRLQKETKSKDVEAQAERQAQESWSACVLLASGRRSTTTRKPAVQTS